MPAQDKTNTYYSQYNFDNADCLSVSEAASVLRISSSTLRRLESEGKITSERMANGYRCFKLSNILDYKKLTDSAKLESKIQRTNVQEAVKPAAVKPTIITKKEVELKNAQVAAKSYAAAQKKIYKFSRYATNVSAAALGILAFIVIAKSASGINFSHKLNCVIDNVYNVDKVGCVMGFSARATETTEKLALETSTKMLGSVLGDRSRNPNFLFTLNAPSVFKENITAEKDIDVSGLARLYGGLETNNQNGDFGTGTIIAGNLNFTGTRTINNLGAIDTTTETTLEAALDINGDVVGTSLNNVKIARLGGIQLGTLDDDSDGNILMVQSGKIENVPQSEITEVGTIGAGTWEGDPVQTSFGGTGLTSYNIGDLLYGAGSNALRALPIGPDGYVLTAQAGVPSWQALAGTGDITGVGNIATGAAFTGSDLANALTFEGSTVTQDANDTTVTAVNPASNVTYTLPDLGTNGTFAFLEGTQTFTGNKTFNGISTFSGTTNFNNNVTFANTTLLDLSSVTHANATNQGLRLPVGNVLVNPTSGQGYMAFETSTNMVKIYDGNNWVSISGASTTLQQAYNAGNSINTTDGRNISILLQNTATDQTFEIAQAGAADAFRVNDDGTYNDATAFVIDAAGNVGIGTTVPGYKLEINGSVNATSFYIGGAQITSTAAELNYLSGLPVTGGAVIYTNGTSLASTGTGASGYILQSNGAGAPTWVSASGAGINYWNRSSATLSPVNPNDVMDITSATGVPITLTNSGTGNSFVVNDVAADTTPFLVDANGNVGIGEATPTALLTVGNNDVFQVNSAGAIAAATGMTSSGTITFSSLTANQFVKTTTGGQLTTSSNVDLGTETTGDYVSNITGGNGITSTGAATGETISHTLSVDATTAGTTLTTSANSGIESTATGIRLLGGCANNEVLAWNAGGATWDCSSVSGIGAGDITAVGDVTNGSAFTGNGDGNTLTFEGTGVDDVNNIILTALNPSATRTYTLPDLGTNGTFVFLEGTQTFLGDKTFGGSLTTNGSANINGQLNANGNILLGDATTDAITFTGRIAQDSDIIPITTAGTSDLGSAALPWDNIFVNGINFNNTVITATGTEINLLSGRSGTLLDSVNVGTYATTAVTAGSGLTGGGTNGALTIDIGVSNGITVNANDISVDATTSGTTSTTSANSGIESTATGIRLLGGCADAQVLAWNTASAVWQCASAGGAGDITAVGDVTSGSAFTGANDGNNLTFEGTVNDAFDITVNALATSASRTYSLPDLGTNGTFAFLEGTQTFSGNKTFSGSLTATGTVSLGNGSSTVAVDSSSWDITSAGVASGFTGITSSGTITLSDLAANQFVKTTTGGQLTTSANVALGTETTGDYISNIVAGSGIATTGAATGETISHTLSVDATTTGTTSTTSANSGLESTATGIRLLGGCANNEVLAWDSGSAIWACTSVGGIGAGDITAVGDVTNGSAFTGNGDGNILTFEGTGADDANNIILTALNPSLTRTYTLPDLGTNGTFAFLEGTQTFLGDKTFSGSLSTTGTAYINGTLNIGDTSGDIVNISAGTWTFANDTNFALSGGTNGLSFDGSTFSVDASNHRIGIGTTSPTDALTLWNANAGDINLRIRANISGSDLYLGTSGADLGVIKTGVNDSLALQVNNGVDAVRISNVGNVGIGTTNPTSKLDIVGTGTAQLKISYDSSNHLTTTVFSNGAITYDSTGAGAAFTFSDGVTASSTLTSSGDFSANGNSTLGDAITDSITFTARVAQDSDIIPITTAGTSDLGSATLPWDNIFVNGITFNGTAITATGTEINLLSGRSGTLLDSVNVSSYATTAVTAGSGLTGGGTTGALTLDIGASNGITVNANDIAVDATTTGTTATTSANSGIESTATGIRLLGGCANNEVLSWNASSAVWACTSVGGIGAGDITAVGDQASGTAFTGNNDGNSLTFEGAINDAFDITVNAASSSANRTYTLPDLGTNGTFAFLEGTQTFTGAKSFTNAAGISVGQNVTAGTTNVPGKVVLISDGDNAFSTTFVTTTQTQDITYTLPANDGNSNQVLTSDGSGGLTWQTVTGIGGVGDITDIGNITTGAAFTGSDLANQLIFEGSTSVQNANDITLDAVDPAASRTYTLPDLGTNGTFAFLEGTQAFTGDKTFNGSFTTAGSANINGQAYINGNLTIGDAITDAITITGRIAQDSDIIPITTAGTSDLGSAALPWDNIFVNGITFNGTAITATGTEINLLSGRTGTLVDSNNVSTYATTAVTAGSGLTGGGTTGALTLDIGASNGITVNANDIAVDATTTGTTATTSANSGIESTATGIRLLGGCSDTQVLAWNAGSSVWQCSTPTTGDITAVGDQNSGSAFTGNNDGNSLTFEGATNDAFDITVNAASSSASRTYTLPDLGTNGTFAFLEGAQTFNGDKTFSGSLTATGTISLGNGSNSIAIDSSVWDITSAGVASGFTGITSSGTVTFSGLTANQFVKTTTGGQLTTAADVTLGTETTGDYVSNITAGNGISSTGATIGETISHTLSVDATTTGTTSTTSANSGIESTATGIRLLGGCANNEVLAWNASDATWGCSSVSGIGAGDITAVGDVTNGSAFTGNGDGNTLTFEGTGVDDANNVIITALNPVATRTYTLPDLGTNGTFAFLEGTQTFLGDKTFNGALTTSGSANINGQLNANGNILLGDAITDAIAITGRIAQDSDIIPITTAGTSDLGSATLPWDNIFVNGITFNGTAITATGTEINLLSGRTGTLVDSNNVSTYATTAVTAGSGLTGGGTTGALTLDIGANNGITVNANDIAVDATTTGTTATTSANSGIESTSTGIRLLGGCANNEVLAWNSGTAVWACTSVGGIGAGDITAVGDVTSGSAFTGANDGNSLTFEGTVNDAFDVTINALATSANRTYSLPDLGTNGTFAFLEGTQIFSGDKTFSGSLTTTGTANINGTLNIGDAVGDIVNVSSGTWTFANDTNFALSGGTNGFSIDGTTFSVDASNDRIGIGNTTPAYTLDVTGSARISTNLGVMGANPTANYGLTTLVDANNERAISNSITLSASGAAGYGLYNGLSLSGVGGKTAYGVYNNFAQSGLTAGTGTQVGVSNNASFSIGSLSESATLVGTDNTFSVGQTASPAGPVTLYGSRNTLTLTGTQGSASGYGIYNALTSSAAGATDTMYGTYTSLSTSANDTAYGEYITSTSAAGTQYGVYGTFSGAATRFGIYFEGEANNYFSGNVGIGTTSPNNKLEISSTTTPQLRLAYDTSNYATQAVASDGATTFDATGAGAAFTFSDAVTASSTLTSSGDFTANGNTTLGNAITDSITLTARIAQDSDIIPITTAGTSDLGSATLPWDNLFVNGITFNGTAITATGTEINLLSGRSGTLLDSVNVGSYATTAVTAGSGLTGGGTTGALTLDIGAGNGINVNANDIAIDATTTGTTTTTSANSGIESTATGIRLLGGCANDEVLSWNAGSAVWQCNSVSGIGGGDISEVGDQASGSAFTGAGDGNTLTFEGTGVDDANNVIITALNPAATRTYTLPDLGSNGTFAFLEGTQTFTGAKTFDNTTVFNGNLTLGNASGDITTVNSGAWTFANDTNLSLSGGVNGFSFDTETLSIDASNNRIGIGTTAPAARLTVEDTSGLGIVLTYAGSNKAVINTTGSDAEFKLYDGANVNGIKLSAWSGYSSFILGSLGIGTTAPGTKLSVSGGASFGTIYSSSAVSDGNIILSGALAVGTSDPSSYAIRAEGSGGLAITSGVNPRALLNTVGGDGELKLYDSANVNGIKFNSWSGGSSFVLGTLGIGTSAPDSRLHIAVGDTYVAPNTGYTFNNASGNEDLYVFGNFENDGNSYLTSLFLGGTQVTSSATELNTLDGVNATLTFTELNLLDGRSGTLVDSVNVGSYATTAVTAGSGLTGGGTIGALTIDIGAGNGIVVNANDIAIDATTTGTTTTTSSNSGIEATAAGIRLLGGCANDEVLSWDSTGSVWQCNTVSGIGGGDISAVGNITTGDAFTGSDLANSLIFEGSNSVQNANDITVTAVDPATSVTYTLPDIGSDGTFAFLQGTQTFTGAKTFDNTTVFNGDLTLGNASSDTVTVNSADWTFANDTNFVLSGGANGLSFDTDTLSIDASNNRVGIGTTAPAALFTVGSSNQFQINSTGQVGLYMAPSNDYAFSLTGTSTNDNSRVIHVTQDNDAAESSYGISVYSTATPPTLSGSTRNITGYSSTVAPSGTISVTNIGTLNLSGISNTVTDNNVVSFGTNPAVGNYANIYGESINITASPIYASTATAGDIYRAAGISSSLTGTPVLTNVPTGSTYTTYGAFISNGVSSPGDSSLAANIYGIYTDITGDLTTTGATTHYGEYINITGTADNNYGLFINAVTSADNNYSIYSATTAQSYFAGNITTDANITLNSTDSYMDLGAITHATTVPQGFRLPQNTSLANPSSGEGYLAWDSDDNLVQVFNGTTWVSISGSATTLQQAYDAGNTITTTSGRDIDFTLADTATDATFRLTQAGTANAFFVGDDGTFTDSTPFVINASGNVGIGEAASSSFKVGIANATTNTSTILLDTLLNATHSSNGTYSQVRNYNSFNILGTGSNAGTIYSEFDNTSYQNTNTLAGAIGKSVTISNDSSGTITSAIAIEANIDNSGTIGTGYGLYIQDIDATSDYGIYQVATSDSNFFAGNVGIGTPTPGNALEIIGTSAPQFRIGYDASNYSTTNVASNGATTFDATGSGAAFTFSDNVTAAANLTTTGTATFNGVVNVGDAAGDIVNVSSGTWNFANDTNYTLTGGVNGLSFDGSTLSVDASNNRIGIGTTAPSSVLDVVDATITTGNGISGTFNALTSGYGLNLASTSTALSTGRLASVDWSPSGTTQIYATGDIVNINIGQYGNVGNLINITDNGTTLFSVSESAITSALPHNFTAAGDVSMAYDLQFTNQTASYIKSKAPLYIEAGESFENNDLTLTTYGSGNIIATLGTTGAFIPSADNSFDIGTTTNRWQDLRLAGTATIAGNVGIGTTSPTSKLELVGTGTSQVKIGYDASNYITQTIASNGAVTYDATGSGAGFSFIDGITAGSNLTLSASTGLLDLSAITHATNAISGLKLPQAASLGSGPSAGEGFIAYDTTTNTPYVWNGTSWASIGGSTTTLQQAYDAGNTITGTTGRNISFTLADLATDQVFEVTQAGTANAFRVNDDGTFTDTTPFLIDASGNVGIGTTTPAATLDIVSTGTQIRAGYDGSNYTTMGVASNGATTFDAAGAGAAFTFSDNVTMAANLTTSGTANMNGTLNIGDAAGDIVNVSSGTWTFANDTNFTLSGGVNGLSFDGSTFSVNATSNRIGIGTTAPSSVLDVVDATITTGNGISGTFNALTSGYGLSVSSTSTALTSGRLASMDWSPSGTAQIYATGDLVNINLGQYGNIGNLINITDNGSTLFAVSETAITSALPHSFTASGDVSMAYDLQFTNQTASYIKSNASLEIQAGETFESNNLTLTTYNAGNILNNLTGTGYFKVNSDATTVDGTTSTNDNVAGGFFSTNDLDTISLLVRNRNASAVAMTNVGTAGAQGDPGILTIEGTTSGTGYNLITAFNSNTRSDAAAVFRVRADGNIYGEAAFNATGADYAEYFEKEEDIAQGEMVGLNPTTGKVRKYRAGDQMMGVISEKPSVVGNYKSTMTESDLNAKYALVGLIGQIRLKITSENGEIQAGDAITYSSKFPGTGVKAIASGPMIGRALESYDSSNPNKINMVSVFIRPGWYTPESFALQLDDLGNIVTQFQNVDTVIGANIQQTAQEIVSGMNTSLDTKLAQVSARLDALESSQSTATTQNNYDAKITTINDNLSLINDLLGINGTDQSTEATQSSGSSPYTGILDKIAAGLKEVKDFVNTMGLSKNENTLAVNSDLNVLGAMTASDITITGDANFGLIKLDTLANSINMTGPACFNETTNNHNTTLCDTQTIFIQKNLAGNLDIFNGKIVFEPDGSLTVKGIIKADKYDVTTTGEKASAGKVTIPANTTTFVVTTKALTENSLIMATPDTPVLIGSKKTSSDTFEITLGTTSTKDVEVSWWIIN